MFRTVSIMVLAALALVACGGSDNKAYQPPGSGGSGASVGSLVLTTSTPTLPSSGTTTADIRAFVRDAANNTLADVPVSFSADAGVLNVTQGTSGADGLATATLAAPPGDFSNQTLTVTATAGTATSTVTVNVVGTHWTPIQGPDTAASGQKSTYTASLIDSGNAGVANKAVTISSARGNLLSSSTATTDANGVISFDETITAAGDDTLTVTALGLSVTKTVAVNSDSFSFTTPANDSTEVALNTPQTVTLTWKTGVVPVVGQVVNFATTRGTLSAGSATTDVNGQASVQVQSTTAGAGTVSATAGSSSAQRAVEFVATHPDSIDVQPGVFTLAPNEQTTLTATVRDENSNLVKNTLVSFNLTDTTGGSLSVASARTDSQGHAQTVYTAGSTTSATDGVSITASFVPVGAAPSLPSKSVALTVARRQVFISLGTGNTITEPNEAQYKIQFVIQMTDSAGNGVPNVPLVVSIVSDNYLKGSRAFVNGSWTGYNPVFGPCLDEDVNRNGQLDPGEDFNSSGRLEAGNIALVTPSSVTTDDEGIALIEVKYPQEFAYWLNVTLEASATVSGTEYKRASHFLLPGASTDFNTQTTAPPGPNSPFGINACNLPD